MKVKAYAAKSTKGKLEAFDYEIGPLGSNDVEVEYRIAASATAIWR